MKSIDLIRGSLQMGAGLVARLAKDLRDTPLTPSTPGGKGGDGNHAIWLLGHLATIEASVPNVLMGEPNPYEKWWPIFGMGTTPTAEASKYPSFDELFEGFQSHRAKNLKLLDDIGEDGLDRIPSNIPPGFEKEMATFGKTFNIMALHTLMHTGQLADVRRVVGLPRFV